MLIEFNVANFRSIRERQSLSMVAINRVKQHPSHVIGLQKENKKLPNLLTVAAMYGANAAGKSNIIKALEFMSLFVVKSQQYMQHGELIDKRFPFFAPFKFDESIAKNASEFEVLFIQDGVRYQYGFAANREQVIHEWLLAYPEGAPQRWFERLYSAEKKEYEWYFGSKFKGSHDTAKKNVWQGATRPNGLFLAAAVQNNNVQLVPVFEWFQKKQTVIISSIDPFFSAQQCKYDNNKRGILKFVQVADPSIESINVEEKEMPLEDVGIMLPFVRPEVIQKAQKHIEFKVEFTHINSAEKIDYHNESDGTKKIFNFAGPLLDILEKGKVFVIDELNNSLHPLLVLELIKVFHDPTINKNHAQLIFSTHDISILDREVFRRDQILFVEKDKENTSRFYSLADFKIRPDEALSKGYIKGRYGAIPYLMGDLIK